MYKYNCTSQYIALDGRDTKGFPYWENLDGSGEEQQGFFMNQFTVLVIYVSTLFGKLSFQSFLKMSDIGITKFF